ncbi:hypothetical protein RRG08_041564 [Elysia crispata]|uniref:Splicing factor Cactin n=1 Tax=Elysia crispata TaxID=231223 RepID=A0AAE0ZUY8_9GAST|nr:hypothetical protein RRG08_041564 [Elysia crispata]
MVVKVFAMGKSSERKHKSSSRSHHHKKKAEKELLKALETPEEKRARRLAKKGLTIQDLEDLLEDIKVYLELEEGKNADYWRDIITVTQDELAKLRKLDTNSRGYWESLLQQLKAYKARTRLRERHQDVLRQKLHKFKREDIAFKIVNREWEYSYKRGFRCQFHNNIFQLWFHFKRYRYRR